jgi:hypothetical protein
LARSIASLAFFEERVDAPQILDRSCSLTEW